MSSFTFAENGTEMEFVKNPWDSAAFGRNCYDLMIKMGPTPPSKASITHFINQGDFQTITYRVGTGDDNLRRLILSLGFSHVELQLKCKLVLAKKSRPSRQLGTLRLARPDDNARVEEIANEVFLDTRFRHIPNLSPRRIGQRFSSWTNQLYKESPEYAYVLETDGGVMGYFYSKPTANPNELYAALGGISSECRGPHGFYLYPAVMSAYCNSGIKTVVSAIAADNIGALNLWAGLGARFPYAQDFYMWSAES